MQGKQVELMLTFNYSLKLRVCPTIDLPIRNLKLCFFTTQNGQDL